MHNFIEMAVLKGTLASLLILSFSLVADVSYGIFRELINRTLRD